MSLTVEEIQAIVSAELNVKIGDLLGESHKRDIAWPRQIAIYYTYRLTDINLTAISAAFNRRRNTVLQSHRAHAKRILTKNVYARMNERVGKAIEAYIVIKNLPAASIEHQHNPQVSKGGVR